MTALALGLAFLAAPPAAPIEFKEGLAIRGVMRSGRNPVFTDAVLAQMAANPNWAPKPGDTVEVGDQKRTWEKLAPREDGSFPGNAFGGGYAYFEVESPKEQVMVLESAGWGLVYADGAPRGGDPYGFGYLKLPVKLRAGKTPFLFSSGRGNPSAKLTPPPAPAFLNLGDPTFPDLVVGQTGAFWGAVVVVNASEQWTRDLRVIARLDSGRPYETAVPPIPPLTFRKIPFAVGVDEPIAEPGDRPLSLTLATEDGMLDFQKSSLRVRGPLQTRKVTFWSQIDGSIQYYALNPAQSPDAQALVLTLHGASVEAIGQADAYKGKDWCNIVAPTNRRPYGFDWEEIGRLDAMEVLEHARNSLKTDPLQTYLTGHSMGGHGAWTVGFHFPDQWGAVAPCAAWISFFTYGGGAHAEPKNPVDEVLFRAANASETLLMLPNAMNWPIYIHHGDKDETVPIREARTMKETLEKAGHGSVTLHEQPGGGHWFGESVDFAPIFDLFKTVRRTPPAQKDAVDFATANLAATSKAWWVQILRQEVPMAVSRVRFKRTGGRVVGTTENVQALRLESEAFLGAGNPRVVEIDGQTLSFPNTIEPAPAMTLVKRLGKWVANGSDLRSGKTPKQTGPFKNVFRNTFQFVYGTAGTPEETAANLNKARYDAEVFGYRGNGSAAILSDRDYMAFLEEQSKLVFIRKPDVPNVILYGNATTNAAYSTVLDEMPLRVVRGEVRVGEKAFKGDDLACLIVRPRKDDSEALVGIVASTGPAGQRVLERLPYFVSGVHYPDWIVISAEMLLKGSAGIRAAGFFGNDWSLDPKDFAENRAGGTS